MVWRFFCAGGLMRKGIRIMTTQTLAIRINTQNPNHHLFNNNGTWFIHYTRCPTPITAERVRRSLGTKSLDEARKRRDIVLGFYRPERKKVRVCGCR